MTLLIVDTGPLVSLLSRTEANHEWCVKALAGYEGNLLTCEAVLTEAFFLLDRTRAGTHALWDMLRRDLLQVSFVLCQELEAVQALKTKYQDVPMSLADASLVRMAELFSGAKVMTLDTDFQVYRKNKHEPIPCIAPWNVSASS